jgi:transmembrane sensor
MNDRAIPPLDVLEEAAHWFAVLGSEASGSVERQAWQRWFDSSADHREAWRRVELVNARFNALPGPSARKALADAGARRGGLKALMLLCIAGGFGSLVASRRDGRELVAALAADFHTATGGIASLPLADGTRAWLNTASAANIVYTNTERRIVLTRGEILIDTAPDPQAPPRPFMVESHAGRLLALGTRFSVRSLEQGVRLAVYQGAVQVDAAGRGGRRVVPAGFQLTFDADRIGAITPARDEDTAWTRKLLIATQMRLDDFLAELGRYRHGYLGCDPALAGLQLVGSYPLDDTDRALALLEATLPVQVRRRLPGWVTVVPRQEA